MKLANAVQANSYKHSNNEDINAYLIWNVVWVGWVTHNAFGSIPPHL